MKKILATVLLCGALSVFMIGCSSSDDSASDESESTDETTEQESTDEQTFEVGDTWTVDGQWEFTIKSVKTTKERNEYYDEDQDDDPAQVIVINYQYKNLGYEDESGYWDGLFINPELNTLIDADGNVCTSYPAGVDKYPQETPVDAKCTAQAAFGLMDKGKSATLTIDQNDDNGESHSATFNLTWK